MRPASTVQSVGRRVSGHAVTKTPVTGTRSAARRCTGPRSTTASTSFRCWFATTPTSTSVRRAGEPSPPLPLTGPARASADVGAAEPRPGRGARAWGEGSPVPISTGALPCASEVRFWKVAPRRPRNGRDGHRVCLGRPFGTLVARPRRRAGEHESAAERAGAVR